jgi:hypothetical protein
MAVATSIMVGLAVAGAVTTAYGIKKAGDAAKDAGEASARQFEFNAAIAALQGQDAAQRGLEEEQRFRSSVRGLVGSQRAGFAAQGVTVNQGSAVDVQADTAYLGELDALQIRANTQREVWGYQVQQEDLLYGAQVARKGGQAAKTASNFQAAGTLIGAGNSLLMSKYGWGTR